MADLATAYVRLIPSLKGAESTIKKELSGIDMSGAGKSMGGTMGSGILAGVKEMALGTFLGQALLDGVKSAGQLAADTFAQAFEGASSFEQLAGGVEKIFDQANQDQIFADAQSAYKDLNMSANDYLDTINQVGATFAQTMGDQAGYDTARKGMLAIADYASGTGRNLDELNEKYKLISRSAQSYQSIADQFAGILPQTSKDFLAAAQGAGLLSSSYTELTQVPVAEYQAAVTAMLEQGVSDMGLLGNTAMESTETMSGALAMMQTSWQNLLTNLGSGEDVSASVQAVVDSAIAVLQNAVPLIESILSSAGQAIGQLASRAGEYFMEHRTEIFDKVGQFMQGALEGIVTAVPHIVAGIGIVVAAILEYIVTHIPDILRAGGEILLALVKGIIGSVGKMGEAAGKMLKEFIKGVGQFARSVYDAGKDLIGGFVKGIMDSVGNVGKAITDGIGDVIDKAKKFLGIASPSKVFAQIGEYSMLGLVQGIDKTSGKVEQAAGDAVRGMFGVSAVSAVSYAQPTAIGQQPQGVGAGLVLNVTVEGREGEDYYELGRRVGNAAAYELRMQGVTA